MRKLGGWNLDGNWAQSCSGHTSVQSEGLVYSGGLARGDSKLSESPIGMTEGKLTVTAQVVRVSEGVWGRRV